LDVLKRDKCFHGFPQDFDVAFGIQDFLLFVDFVAESFDVGFSNCELGLGVQGV
jgi:hypothetical protein